MAALAAAFFVTALLYASVGFGGGSTYSALLALTGFDFRLLPIMSLCCNIIVVTGGTLRFARAGVLPWRKALTISLLAAPMAILGGLTPISQGAFLMVLGAALVFAGLALMLPRRPEQGSAPTFLSGYIAFAAAPLGYLAGLVGIGGGIFLAPLLHLTRWAVPRQIAATASLFILINSLAGLGGQLAKTGPARFGEALTGGLPLLLAVVAGGQLGSFLALRVLPASVIRWFTAALTIWVGSRLLLAI
jgi:uncharacterized protein